MTWQDILVFFTPLVLGSGGVTYWIRFRHDKKVGVRQEDRYDWDKFTARVTERLDASESRNERLEKRVDILEERIREVTTKYWKAIRYIRDLLDYLKGHENVPEIPEELEEDI